MTHYYLLFPSYRSYFPVVKVFQYISIIFIRISVGLWSFLFAPFHSFDPCYAFFRQPICVLDFIFFSIGNKELLRERRISRRSVSEDKCCEGPNILSCTSHDVSADLVQSQSEEISIHGYNLKFLRKVQPNGLVYRNDNGDEAVLSIREKKKL